MLSNLDIVAYIRFASVYYNFEKKEDFSKFIDTIKKEVLQYDDGDEPITIDEVIKRFSNNEMNFENTADYDKLNAKIDSDVKLIESFKQN